MIDHVNLILPFFYSREDQEEIYDNFKALKTSSDKKSWAAKYCSIYGTGTYEQMMYHLPKRKPLTDIFREDPLEEQSNMVRVCKEFKRKRKQTIGVRNANEESFASPDFEENGCYKTCVLKCTKEFR